MQLCLINLNKIIVFLKFCIIEAHVDFQRSGRSSCEAVKEAWGGGVLQYYFHVTVDLKR